MIEVTLISGKQTPTILFFCEFVKKNKIITDYKSLKSNSFVSFQC